MPYDFDNYKKDALTLPRDKAWSNWAKFDKVGDKVQGFIRDVFYRPAEGQFKEARGITLEQKDGTMINVSVKRLSFILKHTNHLRLGDPLTVVLEEEIPSKQKGYSATKQFGYYGTNVPETEGQKTVAELEVLDMASQGKAATEADKEFEAAGKPEAPASDVPFQSGPANAATGSAQV